MPSLVLLVSALYLKSFATWLKLHINDDGKKISKNSLKVSILFCISFYLILKIYSYSIIDLLSGSQKPQHNGSQCSGTGHPRSRRAYHIHCQLSSQKINLVIRNIVTILICNHIYIIRCDIRHFNEKVLEKKTF